MYHANVDAIDATDLEVVEELHGLVSLRVGRVRVADRLQYFDLIEGSLGEVLRRLDHLQGDEPFVFQVPTQPDRREVAPA